MPESSPTPTPAPSPAPSPSAKAKTDLVLRFLVGAAALVVVLGGLKIAAPLITQFLMVAFIAIIMSPLYYWMRKARFPHWLAVTLLLTGIVCLLAYAATSLVPSAGHDFSENIQSFGGSLRRNLDEFQDWLGKKNIVIPKQATTGLLDLATASVGTIGKRTLSFIGSSSTNTIITLIIVGFVFAELNRLPDRVRSLSWMTATHWQLLTAFVADVRHYMAIKTAISALTGLLVYVGLRLLGVGAPGMLALIAFLFNFVPVIGSLAATLPGVLIALAGKGPGTAAWTLVLYLAVNQVLGSIVEPRIMGKGFGVSPILVLASVIFWGWLLGPAGMLFAVPLTTAVRGAFASVKESRM